MSEKYILVMTRSMAVRIRLEDIVYVERDKRKVHIVTAEDSYTYYERMENIEPLLDSRFYPCLKSCYINLDKVVSMREQKITFEGGQMVYLGRENFGKTLQHYKNYLKNTAI